MKKESAAMADDDQQDQQDIDTSDERSAPDSDDEGREHLRDEGKKALDRMKAQLAEAKRLARVNADAAKKLAEIEDRDKSEVQRLQERLAALEKERESSLTEALRLRIAAKHGIAEEDADLFLTGSDEDTLTRQAERLKEREAQREAAEAEQQRKNGARVPREGHGVSAHDDADANALSILGFGG